MSTSAAVLADAQFSAGIAYRPFQGFEQVYQGLSTQIPIAIPGVLDPDAGKAGMDPNLLAGIPVPFGSKLVLWVPTIFNEGPGPGLSIREYRYRVIWRMRNLRDFRTNRLPYHLPRQSVGQQAQFVVPAAAHVTLFEGLAQSEVAAGSISQFQTRRESVSEAVIETITARSAIPGPALTPSGEEAAYQQGLATNNGSIGSNLTVTYNPIQLDTMGDEFIILVDRPVNPQTIQEDPGVWNFDQDGGLDAGFSAFYGTANGFRAPITDLGVYVLTGANP